jgi:signal recognition particle receptor subunit beta
LGGLEGAKPGQPFRFADWEGGEVGFVGSFARPGKSAPVSDEKAVDGLSELRAWIEEL